MANSIRFDPKKIEYLSALGADERKRLVADIERAHELHSHHIRKAMAEALNHLPWLLRGPVRKFFS